MSQSTAGGRPFPPHLFFFSFFPQGASRWAVYTFLERAISMSPWLHAICFRTKYNIQKKKKATRVIGYHVWELAGLTCSSWVGGIPAVGAFPRPVSQGSRATWHGASLKGHLSGRAAVALNMGNHCVAATAAT